MDIASLENDIYKYKKRIYQYESRIVDLRKDIKQLETLEAEYVGISREFSNRNEESVRKLVSMRNGNMTLRAVSSYIDGMSRMLSGNQYEEAQEGLKESRRIIARKIMELDNEIHQLQDNIEACMREIHYCYRAIDNIQAKEVAELV